MIEFTERVGAEPKVIPTPEKAEPKKPAESVKDAETDEKETKDNGKSSEAQKHEDEKDVQH